MVLPHWGNAIHLKQTLPLDSPTPNTPQNTTLSPLSHPHLSSHPSNFPLTLSPSLTSTVTGAGHHGVRLSYSESPYSIPPIPPFLSMSSYLNVPHCFLTSSSLVHVPRMSILVPVGLSHHVLWPKVLAVDGLAAIFQPLFVSISSANFPSPSSSFLLICRHLQLDDAYSVHLPHRIIPSPMSPASFPSGHPHGVRSGDGVPSSLSICRGERSDPPFRRGAASFRTHFGSYNDESYLIFLSSTSTTSPSNSRPPLSLRSHNHVTPAASEASRQSARSAALRQRFPTRSLLSYRFYTTSTSSTHRLLIRPSDDFSLLSLPLPPCGERSEPPIGAQRLRIFGVLKGQGWDLATAAEAALKWNRMRYGWREMEVGMMEARWGWGYL